LFIARRLLLPTMTDNSTYTLTRDQIMAIAQRAATDAVNMALFELLPAGDVPPLAATIAPSELDGTRRHRRRLNAHQRELLAQFRNQ